jgi:hypothetical protein
MDNVNPIPTRRRRISEQLEALARRPFAHNRALLLELVKRVHAMETLQADPAALRKVVGECAAVMREGRLGQDRARAVARVGAGSALRLAPRAGLEPATRGLEGRRSIQLSYRGGCL